MDAYDRSMLETGSIPLVTSDWEEMEAQPCLTLQVTVLCPCSRQRHTLVGFSLDSNSPLWAKRYFRPSEWSMLYAYGLDAELTGSFKDSRNAR